MSDYTAPIREMRFVMDEIANLAGVSGLPGYQEAGADLADAVLDEAAKLAGEVLAPLNRTGDRQGAHAENGHVTTPPGWKEAYRAFCDGGWNGIASPAAYGGQDLPDTLAVAVKEMICSANMAFSIGPLLTTGACAALLHCATDEIKERYLHRMIAGEWTGTMNLTEPQAGSDLALLRTRAEPQGDGSYRLFGQKIFISYGEHDMTANIVHLVLARLPDAPAGVRGISLFVVPKFLVNADGSLGSRNDVRCVSIEHKMGIHGSPTAVLAYGDQGGAVGHMVGEPNRGLEYMFVMMNEARLGVGLQGVAIGERAYQQGLAYARDRLQGRDALTGEALVAIVRHPDVRRMLLLMKSQVEAARSMVYWVSSLMDHARRHPDEETRTSTLALIELMIPIVKGWSTEMGVEVASLNVQIHGGMGFIEETGAAQHLRDSRITTIYEGTTGIQANDLIFRKLLRDGGATARVLFAMIGETAAGLGAATDPELSAIGRRLAAGLEAWSRSTAWIAAEVKGSPAAVLTAAVPYLQLAGVVCGGWQLGRGALAAARRLAAGGDDEGFLKARIGSARFFADHVLPRALAAAETVCAGASALANWDDAAF